MLASISVTEGKLPCIGQKHLTIQYMQKREDFRAAARAVSSKRLGTYMLAFWALLVVLQIPRLHEAMKLSSSFAVALRENAVGVFTVVGVAVFYLLLIWLQPVLSARRAVLREVSWELNDEGVTIANEVSSSQMQWRAFVYFRETPSVFLLFVQKGRAHFLPKRVLSANQLYELRDVLRAHVAERSK